MPRLYTIYGVCTGLVRLSYLLNAREHRLCVCVDSTQSLQVFHSCDNFSFDNARNLFRRQIRCDSIALSAFLSVGRVLVDRT